MDRKFDNCLCEKTDLIYNAAQELYARVQNSLAHRREEEE